MYKKISVRLGPAEIEKISSHYLSEGLKQEAWKIDEVEVLGDRLTATVSMRSFYASDTDTRGFHLSFITALEFIAQLQIIYVHVWAGLQEKTQEAWLAETRIRSVHPIRDHGHMHVEMHVSSMRKRGAAFYCVANHRITDDQGGLFEIWLKGLVS